MWPMLLYLGGGLLSSAGSAYGGYQAIKQGKYAADILEYQAKYVEAATKIEAAKIDQRIRQTKSAQRAASAASGFQSYAGTDLELQIDTDVQGAIDQAILRSAGGIEQLRYQTQAHMARAQGYGIGSAMYAQSTGSLLNTAGGYGQRAGWFNQRPTYSGYTENPQYPRNFRSF